MGRQDNDSTRVSISAGVDRRSDNRNLLQGQTP